MFAAIDVALKGLVLLAAALLAAQLLRRGSAATRYLVWSSALAGLLLLPLLGAVVPPWRSDLLPAIPQSWTAPETMPTFGAARASKSQNDIAVLPRPTPRAPAVAPGAGPGGTAGSAGRRELEGFAGRRAAPGATRQQETTTGIPASEAAAQTSPTLQRATLSANAVPTWPALLAGFYLFGAAVLVLQLGVGLAGVLRLVRRARPAADGPLRREFEQAVAQLGIERPVMLLETDATAVPLAWELAGAAVLIPPEAHGWPAERRRVALLHELAHVQRRDCPVQLLAQLALAVHWLNPLAWLAIRRLREEREHACDDAVLRLGTRASDYADHLLQIARGLRPAREPAWASLAMARSARLEGRVAAILDPRSSRRLPRRRNLMIALIISVVLLLPLAALQPGVAAQATETDTTTPGVETTQTAGAATQQRFVTPYVSTPHVPEHQASAQAPEHEAPSPAPEPGAPLHVSERDSFPPAAAGQDDRPSVEELVQMRIHGVSVEFIEQVRAAFGRPVSVRELVQMRIHGTTPEFVRGVQEAFPNDDVDIRDVTNMRIHGATVEYIRDMRAALGADLSMNDISNLRIHGASPEFVRAMRELLGDEQLSARDITNMRIHGASEEYVRTMRELLVDEQLSVRDLTSMRIHGVTTELVRELQEDGFENLTADDLVQMKIHGFDRWLQRRRGGR
jgi:beta-lactamase regulating signal transducer with metallopeptidase domain